jgi:hypothetical protein
LCDVINWRPFYLISSFSTNGCSLIDHKPWSTTTSLRDLFQSTLEKTIVLNVWKSRVVLHSRNIFLIDKMIRLFEDHYLRIMLEETEISILRKIANFVFYFVVPFPEVFRALKRKQIIWCWVILVKFKDTQSSFIRFVF